MEPAMDPAAEPVAEEYASAYAEPQSTEVQSTEYQQDDDVMLAVPRPRPNRWLTSRLPCITAPPADYQKLVRPANHHSHLPDNGYLPDASSPC